MGNCQASEVSAVLIQHPEDNNKVERIYWSVSAQQVMNSNAGHYVAHVVESQAEMSGDGTPLKQLKLLRPDDALLVGQVYRLVSFEDVLKQFSGRKCVKLGKLLKQSREGIHQKKKKKKKLTDHPNPNPETDPDPICETCSSVQEIYQFGSISGGSSSSRRRGVGRYIGGGGGQWKPALQSIAEVAT